MGGWVTETRRVGSGDSKRSAQINVVESKTDNKIRISRANLQFTVSRAVWAEGRRCPHYAVPEIAAKSEAEKKSEEVDIVRLPHRSLEAVTSEKPAPLWGGRYKYPTFNQPTPADKHFDHRIISAAYFRSHPLLFYSSSSSSS